MTTLDYLDLILRGYFDNAEYLDKHIYRECIRAEENHIGFVEFFDRLLKAYDLLIQDRDKTYHESLREYYLLVSMRKSKDQPIEDLEKPIKENYGSYLFGITSKYIGNLNSNELSLISNAIVNAWEAIKLKNSQIKTILKRDTPTEKL